MGIKFKLTYDELEVQNRAMNKILTNEKTQECEHVPGNLNYMQTQYVCKKCNKEIEEDF